VALAALLYAHIALFESHGIAPPASSDPTQRRRYTVKDDERHVPFMPHIFWYITKWGLLYVGLLLGIAALWPWTLPTYVGNLAAAGAVTEPDWYFLWLFKFVDFAGVTPVLAVGITTVLIVYVLFLPFLDRSKRTHPRDRPLFIWIATSLLGFFIVMTVWGGETPGVQITPPVVAETIGPIFAVNAVVTILFHWRYVRSYRRRLASRVPNFPGVYAAPDAPPGSGLPLGAQEAKSVD